MACRYAALAFWSPNGYEEPEAGGEDAAAIDVDANAISWIDGGIIRWSP